MNIPDEVRTAILNCTKLVRNRGFPGDLVDVIMLLDWLQSQPTAPEPDWSTAPKGATHHALFTNGTGIWFDAEPITGTTMWIPTGLWQEVYTFSVTSLELGIDWRTTLRRRPEATA